MLSLFQLLKIEYTESNIMNMRANDKSSLYPILCDCNENERCHWLSKCSNVRNCVTCDVSCKPNCQNQV